MNPVAYLKKNGIQRTIEVLYRFKLQQIYEKIMLSFTKGKPLKNIILIESHNDFDSNGGAFYDYLIKHEYNQSYKIVWQLKHKLKQKLPHNVKAVPLCKPSLRRAYYRCVSQIMTSDCYYAPKVREDQVSFYFTHGPIGLKNCKGCVPVLENVDYCLSPSEFYGPILADQFSMPYDEKWIVLGYPMHDILYTSPTDELKKITEQKFDRVVLWMPTFRKGGGFKRNDSTEELPLGIPLIVSQEQYKKLNAELAKRNCLLIIKMHPMQDPDTIHLEEASNIRVLTGETVRQLGVNNYRLMKETDAMISDYSSIAYDYLHLDKPIGYMMSDAESYKLGFVVEDPRTLMAGDVINTFDDLVCFIQNVADGVDPYQEARHKLFDKLFCYHDGNSCERIVDFMKLTKKGGK